MDERLTGRNGLIWAAYVRGATQESIGAEYGISHQRVSQVIADVRDSIPEEKRADLVRREIDFLDGLRRQAMVLVDADPIPAYSNGRPIELENGTIAQDHTGRLQAMDRAIKISERLAKMAGLDAADKNAERLGEEIGELLTALLSNTDDDHP